MDIHDNANATGKVPADPNQQPLPFGPAEGQPAEPAQNAPAPRGKQPPLNRNQARRAGQVAKKEHRKAQKAAEAEARRKRKEAEKAAVGRKGRRAVPIVVPTPEDSLLVKPPVVHLSYANLNDRQSDGFDLYEQSLVHNGDCVLLTADITLWASSRGASWAVTRTPTDVAGALGWKYECTCFDRKKRAEIDCKHVFAEKVRRGEVVVDDPPSKSKRKKRTASRRPARKRKAHDGVTIKTAQKRARRKMPLRIPELVECMVRANARDERARGEVIDIRRSRGGQLTPATTRAASLLLKVACGLSADEMESLYQTFINHGVLLLRRPPNGNTLSDWINDPALESILQRYLWYSAQPFRRREVAGIVDSTKVSQLMTAHQRTIEYGKDKENKYKADWLKCHAMVGVETLVVMAVRFSSKNVHDLNFLFDLVDAARGTFPLEVVLADKAYLDDDRLQEFFDRGIRACIPLKDGWYRDEEKIYKEGVYALVEWFDRNNNRDFHEVYRLRPKVEMLFSLLKRLAQGYCWSRGRKRKDSEGKMALPPPDERVAWRNEMLCKLIYLNLRATVHLESETGVMVDYTMPNRFFPPPAEPLIVSRLLAA